MRLYIFLEALKESACALPLPSAMASAKFANMQVNHKITAIASVYPLETSLKPNREIIHNPVVKIADIYTKSITGFCTCVFGLSLINESLIALPSIFYRQKHFLLTVP